MLVLADALMAWLILQLLSNVVVKLWWCGQPCPAAFKLLPLGLQLNAPN